MDRNGTTQNQNTNKKVLFIRNDNFEKLSLIARARSSDINFPRRSHSPDWTLGLRHIFSGSAYENGVEEGEKRRDELNGLINKGCKARIRTLPCREILVGQREQKSSQAEQDSNGLEKFLHRGLLDKMPRLWE